MLQKRLFLKEMSGSHMNWHQKFAEYRLLLY